MSGSSCPKAKMSPADSALFFAGCATFATLIPVAAHQLGLLNHLSDPPLSIFASDRITESKAAHPLGVPDAVLGLGSYAATVALSALARTRPKARRLLALKLLSDGSMAGFNVVRQVVVFRKLCSWCMGTALCTGVMLLTGRNLIVEELGVAE